MATTATSATPSARAAATNASEVLVAGTPAAAASAAACSCAPSQPNAKLPLVQAHTTAAGASGANAFAPAASRSGLPQSSRASRRWASSAITVCRTANGTPTRRVSFA